MYCTLVVVSITSIVFSRVLDRMSFSHRPRLQGVYYWDRQDNRWFDGIGGIYVAVLGHCHPRLLEAARKQMEILTLAPPLHSVSDITLKFVEKLGSIAPGTSKPPPLRSSGSEY